MSGESDGVLFREVQRFRQIWLWALLLSMCAAATAAFCYDCWRQLGGRRPEEHLRSPSLLFIGLAVVTVTAAANLLLLVARLETEVRPGEVFVRFFPFHLKRLRLAVGEIASVEARDYRPIAEFGGWGIRYGWRGGKAYNVRGNRGVQLVFVDGKKLLIGSQRADEMARAIEAAREAKPA